MELGSDGNSARSVISGGAAVARTLLRVPTVKGRWRASHAARWLVRLCIMPWVQ
jgi:hypothetical protein